MAAEINKEDLISDQALLAPHELGDAFAAAEKDLDHFIKTILRYEEAAKDQTTTITKLTKRVDLLEKEQKALAETNKKLVEETKKSKKALDDQRASMEALDNRTGGVIGRFRTMGKELLQLAKSPVILFLGVVIGLLAAASSAVKTFYSSTGEGEDILARQSSIWNQFFNNLKVGWGNTGKVISSAIDSVKGKLVDFLANVLAPFSKVAQDQFKKEIEQAEKLADVLDAINDRLTANIVTEAKTRKQVNELVLKSQDDINNSDQQRLTFLEQSIDLQEKQMLVNVDLFSAQSKALLNEIGLRHKLTEEQVKALTQAQRLAIFTEEENKQMAESIAKVIDAEGNYYQEVRRNTVRVINLKQEIYKKDLQAAEKAAQDKIQSLKVIMDEEIEQVRYSVGLREITERQGEARILKIRKDYANLFAQQQIDSVNQILDTMQLLPEDRAKFEQELYKLGVDLQESFFEGFNERNTDIEELFNKIKKQFDAFAGSAVSIFEGITEKRLQEIAKQEQANDAQLDRELKAAGDNEEAKEKIGIKFQKKQEALERQRIALLRRAAIFEKAISVAQATINTAVAVTALLETPPLAILAGAAGALQVAAILAQPLPAYKDGGITDSPIVKVGEAGTEAFVTPDGKVGFTPDSTTIMALPVGTEIFTADDTISALARAGLRQDSTIGSGADARLENAMRKGFRSLIKTVKNKREVHINFGTRGAEASLKNAETWVRMMNEFYG